MAVHGFLLAVGDSVLPVLKAGVDNSFCTDR